MLIIFKALSIEVLCYAVSLWQNIAPISPDDILYFLNLSTSDSKFPKRNALLVIVTFNG